MKNFSSTNGKQKANPSFILHCSWRSTSSTPGNGWRNMAPQVGNHDFQGSSKAVAKGKARVPPASFFRSYQTIGCFWGSAQRVLSCGTIPMDFYFFEWWIWYLGGGFFIYMMVSTGSRSSVAKWKKMRMRCFENDSAGMQEASILSQMHRKESISFLWIGFDMASNQFVELQDILGYLVLSSLFLSLEMDIGFVVPKHFILLRGQEKTVAQHHGRHSSLQVRNSKQLKSTNSIGATTSEVSHIKRACKQSPWCFFSFFKQKEMVSNWNGNCWAFPHLTSRWLFRRCFSFDHALATAPQGPSEFVLEIGSCVGQNRMGSLLPFLYGFYRDW